MSELTTSRRAGSNLMEAGREIAAAGAAGRGEAGVATGGRQAVQLRSGCGSRHERAESSVSYRGADGSMEPCARVVRSLPHPRVAYLSRVCTG